MMSINKKNSTIVASELVSKIKNQITGEDEEWLFGKKPSECIMVGMVGESKNEKSIIKGEIVDDLKFDDIPSMGIRFHYNSKKSKASISFKGKLFYRIKPTFEEQVKYLVEKYSKSCIDDSIFDLASLKDYINRQKEDASYVEPKEEIVKIYKSINLDDFGCINVDLNFPNDCKNEINKFLYRKIEEAVEKIKQFSFNGKNVSRNITSFLSKDSFESIIDSSFTQICPKWVVNVYCEMNTYEKYNEFVLQLINDTETIDLPLAYETKIFNAGLIVRGEEKFLPIEINSIKYYYLDKPYLAAIGNNCTIKEIENGVETENFPITYEYRLVTMNQFNSYIEFSSLIDNPIKNLFYIYKKLNIQLEKYRAELTKNSHPTFKSEISEFEHEINRFKKGIDLIENKSDIRLAFKLMNKTFSKNKYKGWRLFQIVFIVSELSDLVNCEYENTLNFNCNEINNVDLIYFPTGGGKTETFLGCAFFASFFDRIRGKNDGATAIIKYPLRLLAAQQLDRVLKLSVFANEVKNEEKIKGDEFSVGFFTGSGNTPNKIDEKKAAEIDLLTQEDRNSVYRQVDYCPICGGEVDIYFDRDEWRLKHKCKNSDCNYFPPIYIVDDEIYRYAPTFIISTIDKMANIGTSLGFKALFGQTNCKCKKHGFILSGKKCQINSCHCEIETDIMRKDPIPTLFIQDELHLVNESLGTFDSHYESLIQYFCENLVPKEMRKKIKYIGATATISNYQNHIIGLYGKIAKRFPTSVKKENFYSYVDRSDLSRIIIGTALYGGSITDRIQKIVTQVRIILSGWFKDLDETFNFFKSKGFSGTIEELKNILQLYLIGIIYNNSKKDAGTIRAILENQGNNTLMSEGFNCFNIAEITGDVEFKTIKNVMHEIESSNDKNDCVNIIVATSAISHGVDEDCFNQIYFFGMPNQTSEYIQAYSRVGRTYTGIVFDIFRIIRDKDKSYLKNFYNYHDYKDLLIDPVPINRYAKNAIYSTLPGIVASLLYQHYVKKYYAIEVTKKINNGLLNYQQLQNDLETIYDCDKNDSKLYKEIIDTELKSIFESFKTNTSSEITIAELIAQSNSKHKGPMTNLRDVDVPLELSLKDE